MGVGIGGGSTEVSGKQAFDKLRGYTVLEKLAAALATGRTCRLVPMLLVGSTVPVQREAPFEDCRSPLLLHPYVHERAC